MRFQFWEASVALCRLEGQKRAASTTAQEARGQSCQTLLEVIAACAVDRGERNALPAKRCRTYRGRMKQLVRSAFAASDPEEAAPVLRPFFPGAKLSRTRDGDFHFDLDVVDAEVLSTIRYRFTSPNSSGISDGTGVVTIGHLIEGKLSMSAGKTDIDTSRPFLIPPRAFQATWDDVHLGGVNLDLREVERFATQLSGSASFAFAFTGIAPVSPVLLRFWRATVRSLNRDLLRDDEAMASPLVRRAVFEQVALAALRVFPNTLMELRDPQVSGEAVGAAVRRARTFIDENLTEPITVADIAAASGLSVRGLAAAFRRELDATPMAVLRSGRLAGAHRQLIASDPTAGDSVAAIARRWGFSNTGRFAVLHRAEFGTDPASVLRC